MIFRSFFSIFLCTFSLALTAQESPVVKPFNLQTFSPLKTSNTAENLSENQEHPEFGTLPFNTQCDDCSELIEKRKENERFFVKNGTDGDVFYIQKSYGPLHFQQQGEWLTIDHRLKPVATNKFAALQQPEPVTIDLSQNFTAIGLDGGELQFAIDPQLTFSSASGDHTYHSTTDDYSAGDDGVFINDFWQDS